MSHFASDADLLACEPTVFTDVPLTNQQILQVTDAALSGVTVTSDTGGFSALEAEQVAVLRSGEADAAAFAIASVDDDHTLTLATAPSHFAVSTGLTLMGRTFAPQRQVIHEQLMRCLGLDPDGEDLDESAVVSVGLVRRLETLGTLWKVYEAGSTLLGDNTLMAAKTAQYGRHFNRALAGAVVLIDADGDGLADEQRTPGVGRLVRV